MFWNVCEFCIRLFAYIRFRWFQDWKKTLKKKSEKNYRHFFFRFLRIFWNVSKRIVIKIGTRLNLSSLFFIEKYVPETENLVQQKNSENLFGISFRALRTHLYVTKNLIWPIFRVHPTLKIGQIKFLLSLQVVL